MASPKRRSIRYISVSASELKGAVHRKAECGTKRALIKPITVKGEEFKLKTRVFREDWKLQRAFILSFSQINRGLLTRTLVVKFLIVIFVFKVKLVRPNLGF